MSDEVKATRSARELAETHKINLADVVPSDGKKISEADVEAFIQAQKSGAGDGAAPEPEEKPETAQPPAAPEPEGNQKKGDVVCIYRIKEGGQVWNPGEKYTGKNAKELIALGSVKKV